MMTSLRQGCYYTPTEGVDVVPEKLSTCQLKSKAAIVRCILEILNILTLTTRPRNDLTYIIKAISLISIVNSLSFSMSKIKYK